VLNKRWNIFFTVVTIKWERILTIPENVGFHCAQPNAASYSWVLDTTRAKDELGWQPCYHSRQALQIMLKTHGYHLTEIE
jgi:hypothetical protein